MSKFSLIGNTEIQEYKGGECFVIVDTETDGLPPKGLVYDVGLTFVELLEGGGLAIVNRHGVLVEEVFSNPKQMKHAYFADKVFTCYPMLLSSGEEKLKPWTLAMLEIGYLFDRYKVKKIGAYNANFDQRMLSATALHLNGSDPFSDLEWFDLWQIACNTVLSTQAFKSWAVSNGWVSPKGNILTSAEVCYNYLSLSDFTEDHTALSDSMIEAHILLAISKDYGLGRFNSSSMRGRTWQAVNDAATKEWTRRQQEAAITIKKSLETRY